MPTAARPRFPRAVGSRPSPARRATWWRATSMPRATYSPTRTDRGSLPSGTDVRPGRRLLSPHGGAFTANSRAHAHRREHPALEREPAENDGGDDADLCPHPVLLHVWTDSWPHSVLSRIG